jgi:spore coat protein JC
MWIYEKKLQFPVKIKNPNPKLAQIIISQLGGPDGELGASMRYLHQRYSMPYKEVVGILTDVGSEASEMFYYCNASKIPDTDSLLIYTITTKERVLRYGVNNRIAFFERPNLVSHDKERRINIHVALPNSR